MRAFLVAFGLSCLSAGCASSDRLPEDVLAAARAVTGEGGLWIQIDDEGRVHRIAADVPLSETPQVVKDSVERERPGGRLAACKRLWVGEAPTFAIAKVVRAMEQIVVVDAGGTVLWTESEIPAAKAPQSILDAANAAVPTGSILSVFEIREGDRLEYRIRKRVAEQTLSILVGSGGEVPEVLRELPAELRLPRSR